MCLPIISERVVFDVRCRYRCYLGEDEAVIVGVTGVFRSVLHGMKEQHRHDLRHAAA